MKLLFRTMVPNEWFVVSTRGYINMKKIFNFSTQLMLKALRMFNCLLFSYPYDKNKPILLYSQQFL
jgi:hypothetical protein